MIKVGDLVEYKRAAFGRMRGIVLKLHKGGVQVQWFPPTTQNRNWIMKPEENLTVVSGAIYWRGEGA